MPDFILQALAPAQLLGYVGMACALLSYQCKKNRNYFFMQTGCAIAFTLQYLLLGAWSAMLLNVVAIARGIFFSLDEKYRKRSLFLSIEVAFILFAVLSVLIFHEVWWIALAVLIAQAGGTVAMWTRNGKTIRITQLAVVSPLWLLNNFYYFSIGGILCESFNILSVIISFIRFHKTGYDKS